MDLHSTSPVQVGIEHQRSSVKLDNFSDYFVGHSDQDIDLSYVSLNSAIRDEGSSGINSFGSKNYSLKAVPQNIFHDSSVNRPDRLLAGDEIWFVGYPDGRFDERNYLPILRRGYIASLPHCLIAACRFQWKETICYRCTGFPSSSGSPVFARLNGKFSLIGVVSQTMVKYGKLQILTTTEEKDEGIQLTIGLGIVIKTDALQELLDYGYYKKIGLK